MRELYYAFEIIATLSESAIIFYAISSLFEPRFRKNIQICFLIISYLIISLLTVFFNNIAIYSGAFDLIVIFVYIMVTLVLFKGNRFFCVITPIVLVIIVAVINISVSVLMGISFNVTSNLLLDSRAIRAVSLFITKLTFLFIVKFLTRKIRYKNYKLKLSEWLGIIAIFIISLFILVSAAEIQYKKIDNAFNIIILIYGIATINIITFVFVNKMAQKNKNETLLKMMNVHEKEQKKAFQSLKEVYESLKILKHDMKNEWIVIYKALKEGHYDYAEEIAGKMLNFKIESFEDYITVSNPAINALLNYKLNIAKQRGISVISYVQEDFDSFDDYDIVMLISNLLDNAIEASEKVSDTRIIIMVTTKMNYLSIVIANRIEKSVLQKNRLLKTTKNDSLNHGLGIKSVNQICEKYDGMIDYYERENMFVADVMLKKKASNFK